MTELTSLQQTLCVSFKDIALLQEALVHRSYLNESPDCSFPSNERLEFLGDAFLGFVVARKLHADFPALAEGGLTRMRSALVQTRTLARVAESLGLGDYLVMGRGEEETGGRHKPRNLASAFEALVGAILVDQGSERAEEFVLRALASQWQAAARERIEKDPKSTLQELLQANHHLPPVYRLVSATGPDHARVFTVEVLDGEVPLGQGTGVSKQSAEQAAARSALEKLAERDRRV